MSRNPKTKSDSLSNGAEPWEIGSAMFAGFARASDACAKGFSEWNREAVRFAEARLNATQEAAKEFGHCHSIVDFATLQQKWAASAAEAYVSGAAKLADLGLRLVSETIAQMPSIGAMEKHGREIARAKEPHAG